MWTILSLFAAGVGAGALGRLLLLRLRRGTRVAPPWCELAVGVLWALSGWQPVPLVVAWFGVLLSATDLARQRLPNALTLSFLPATGAALCCEPAVLPRAVSAAAVYFAIHALVWFVAPSSMGAGDVKLSGVVGAVLGAVSWSALAAGAVVSSVVTLVLAVTLRRRGRVPHGPGMLAAAWLLTLVPP